MALPGFVRVYNRFPHEFEFQSNMRQYTLPPHAEEVVTVEMAFHAVKQSVYKWSVETDDYLCGVVPFGDEEFGKPILAEELNLDDPILSSQIELNKPGYDYQVISVPTRDTMPGRRKAGNGVKIVVGGGAI